MSRQGEPDEQSDDPVVTVSRLQWDAQRCVSDDDRLVREEPLEIRVAGVPIAVVMRTPGHDEELVRGFLVTEQIAAGAEAIAGVRHCTQVDDPRAENNVIQATLRHPVDLARLRRNLFTTSSCGVCGKASLQQALARAEPFSGDRARAPMVDVRTLYALPDRLREHQSVFEQTGGLHAAGLFTADGTRLVVREDVGRHNAVDKVVGWSQASSGSAEASILMVSGRVSFEIVQKALAARIPIVAAISAPTSLATELATAAGMTLVGFVRRRRLCVYAGPYRIHDAG